MLGALDLSGLPSTFLRAHVSLYSAYSTFVWLRFKFFICRPVFVGTNSACRSVEVVFVVVVIGAVEFCTRLFCGFIVPQFRTCKLSFRCLFNLFLCVFVVLIDGAMEESSISGKC